MKVAILGTGAYGMALASIFYNNKLKVSMWTNSEEEKELLLSKSKSNKIDYIIPKDIIISTDMKEVIEGSSLIVIVVPSKFVRSTTRELKKYYTNQVICIASKGLEDTTRMLLYDVVRSEINTSKIGIISGGTFAEDVVKKVPIGLSVASRSKMAREIIIKSMKNNYVKLRPTRDVIGTEICGSIKNVIAIASGMIDGMGYPISTSSLLITEALNDIKNLSHALGGSKKTILSYAGFGDILLTCTSDKSRNYTLGKLIGSGTSKEEINKYIESTTIEGLNTLVSIKKLLSNRKIKMPIINLIYNIIYGDKSPEELSNFLIRKE